MATVESLPGLYALKTRAQDVHAPGGGIASLQ